MNKQMLLSLCFGLLIVALPACCCKKKQCCTKPVETEQVEQITEEAEVNSEVEKF